MKKKFAMRAATVTFNPAIDETLRIEGFESGKVNRVQSFERHAGGKGVNVATFLADYGIGTSATGFLGERNDAVFTDHFARKGIGDRFVRIKGETRTGIKIIDTHSGETTDINYPGIVPGPAEIMRLGATVAELAEDHDLFVISGSVPAGCDPSIYREIVNLAKSRGRMTAVDTSGAALRHALEAKPDIVKPNIHELEEYTGSTFATMGELVACCRDFLAHGISLAVVSMGADGALFVNDTEALIAVAPVSRVASTVGAGDAMVAGIAAGTMAKLSLEKTAALATAFSLIAISNIELGIREPRDVETLAGTVSIYMLSEQQEELWQKSLR